MSTARKLPVTVAEYLEAETKSPFRSEYRNGEVVAMSGATRAHVLITGNLISVLNTQLKASCRVYFSDLRLWIKAVKLFTYPDVMLSCGKEQVFPGPPESLVNPSLIIEVLSTSTRNYDRGDKFMYYRYIRSLIEYLTVEQATVGVEHWRRSGSQWELREYRDEAAVIDLAIGATLRVADVYDRVEFGDTS